MLAADNMASDVMRGGPTHRGEKREQHLAAQGGGGGALGAQLLLGGLQLLLHLIFLVLQPLDLRQHQTGVSLMRSKLQRCRAIPVRSARVQRQQRHALHRARRNQQRAQMDVSHRDACMIFLQKRVAPAHSPTLEVTQTAYQYNM